MVRPRSYIVQLSESFFDDVGNEWRVFNCSLSLPSGYHVIGVENNVSFKYSSKNNRAELWNCKIRYGKILQGGAGEINPSDVPDHFVRK